MDTKHCVSLATDVIHDMDMDDLLAYGIDRMTEYFESLDDEVFMIEWKNHYDEDFPNK